MKKEDCVFFFFLSGDIPSNTIYENSEFKVIMDASPAAKGHVLVLPKEHYKDIYDIDAETAGKLFQLAAVVARALKEVLNCDGLNILQNNGVIAGQTVFHFHMHLIPRYEGDDVTVKWEGHSMDADEMDQLRRDIRKAL